MLLFDGKDVIYLNKKPVHESKPFNCDEQKLSFYMECLHRKIQKSGPPSIYHYHDNLELLYCIDGELEITLFSESVILKEGDFIFISQNTPHATTAHSNYNEHFCIKFSKQMLHIPSSRTIPPEEYFISLLNEYEFFSCDEKNKDYIYNLFLSSFENFSHDDYYKRLTLGANIMLLMSFVFQNSANKTAKPISEISKKFANVLEYINTNCSTITLEQAANFCSMSYSYFSRNFKSEFGISFTNYVTKKRIEKSLDFLSNSTLSLNDIALECGFSNLSHYIKCFSEEKGMTPRKFRSIVSRK